MKVCLLNDSFPPVIDGVANVVLNYAGIMTEEKMADVMVGTPKYPGAEYHSYPYYVVPYPSFDTTKIVKGYRAGYPVNIPELRDMIDFKPDIIHTHCPVASTYLARILKGANDAPVIFTYHTKFDEDIARAVKSEFIQKETIKVLVNNIESCDEVWTVSEGAAENLKSLGYTGKYRVMGNGVDFEKGRSDAETVKRVTGAYDLPEGVPVFLFVGRMISYKGVPIILDALEKLKKMDIDFRMVLIGSGADLPIFKKTVEDKNLKDKCIFTGPIYDRNELKAWNTRADLFIFPSTYDTNGIVVREAAACGLASVLVKGSCAAEGITDDRNGFLIEQNADSLSEMLSKLAKDIPHMKDVGQHAMDEIYISWNDSVHAAFERYNEILELKKAGKFEGRQMSWQDQIMEMPYEILAETTKQLSKQSRKFDSMIDNVEEFSKNVENEINETMWNAYSDIKHAAKSFYENVSDFKDDIKDFIKDKK